MHDAACLHEVILNGEVKRVKLISPVIVPPTLHSTSSLMNTHSLDTVVARLPEMFRRFLLASMNELLVWNRQCVTNCFMTMV